MVEPEVTKENAGEKRSLIISPCTNQDAHSRHVYPPTFPWEKRSFFYGCVNLMFGMESFHNAPNKNCGTLGLQNPHPECPWKMWIPQAPRLPQNISSKTFPLNTYEEATGELNSLKTCPSL